MNFFKQGVTKMFGSFYPSATKEQPKLETKSIGGQVRIEHVKEQLERMKEAEDKLLTILSYSGQEVTDEEMKTASAALFDVVNHIVELKNLIKTMEGGQDE